MPSTRPQAAFEPIAPDLDLKQLVESTPNFEWATRIHCDMIDHHGLDQFERLVLVHVVLGGKPLVIEGYENRLDKWTFAVQWLKDNHGPKVVDVRELNKDSNVPMTMEHYLKHMSPLTNQWTENNYKEEGRQRMYLKDMDCPDLWHEKLRDQVPLVLFYLNENTGDIGGFGSGSAALNQQDSAEPNKRNKRGIAKAGDLMSSLPKDMQAENLMCYIGHEGTYTPAHREMCASLGHNVMVETSRNAIEDGKMTKAGSSIWFMTETKEREVVSEYWLSRLGHDIEIEKHFAQMNAWKHAPFKTYVVEQKLGDFILIPPLAPHQVWNRGTRTMKVAWNRTTVETLELAMKEALFKARFVCRDEQYKNKAIIYYTMQKYSKLLRDAEKLKRAGSGMHLSDLKVKQLEKDFKRLHGMFTKIMVSESLLPDKSGSKIEFIQFDSNITCSYCRCNIFNRFLTCASCVGKLPNGDDDTYDICMECYAMGRSCACISKLQWVEQFNWKDLTEMHEEFRRQIITAEQKVDAKSPKSLKIELAYLQKKRTLAQVCQVELSRRPWKDITKASGADQDPDDVEREEEIELDINGNVKKSKKKVRRSEKYIREHGRCHVDCYWEPKWKQAHCSKCDKNYCFGNLFRAFDEMPQDILANPNWECPSCRQICGCRNCRNKPGYKKYTPKGTLLGHNTKAVADPRSVESLVDFSHSNIAWIQKAGDDHDENTLRLLRRRKDAELAKARDPQLGEDYVNETPENVEERVLQLAQQEGIPIDPALSGGDVLTGQTDLDDEDTFVEHPEAPRRNPNATPENGVEIEQWVPEGGIIWDSTHAYDATDAITYVYPDLAVQGINAQLPPEPSEGYQQIVPGYEESAPMSPNKIEMIDRKRKRLKLDDGDKPYKWKKGAIIASAKPKMRKSLVISLLIDKERLARKVAEIESTPSQANQASEAHAALLIGSDLQTLNNNYREPEVPVPVHVTGVDPGEVGDEQDDEFTPGRYRDRRKHNADGVIRPPPDADITRRTTRMQAVAYADPSDGEEEFNELLPEKSQTSKLATMEHAVMTLDGTMDKQQRDVHTKDRSKLNGSRKSNQLTTLSGTRGAPSTASGPAPAQQVRLPQANTKAPPVHFSNSTDSSRRSSTDSAESIEKISKVVAAAQANRKAKMAAIEGDDDDSSEEWSDNEEDNPPKSVPPRIPTKSSVGSKAPRLSLPSLTTHKEAVPVSITVPTVVSMQKVSAADWDDTSSDEDLPYTKSDMVPKLTTGFLAVNTKQKGQPITSSGKKRGRPAKTK